ncbi:helix-turn-helix domain-containing protein [Neolewinella litorea]|uniref:Helix-turn-helix domain-containing protein n=1 Tax=Neolewinella litorea TaxID=2562452 RepID=A0A4S4N652_9BACT|nr:helix-turn-helix domain-containing protein [Neolewinella litorea]THH34592.1 helix-turn-helix domain-containing protein [Neolewinella litorea]
MANLTYSNGDSFTKPSKQDQELALTSYDALTEALKQLRTESPEIEIEETGERITVPRSALELLRDVLKSLSKGQAVSVFPIAAEMTTQAAADFLNCSRPYLVKLLEKGEIPFTKVGKHRRIKFEDVHAYRQRMKQEQKQHLIEMMKADEDSGLYDT